MSQRFEYDRLTADKFTTAIVEMGIEPNTFARVFGVRENTVARWINGSQDIPPWVQIALALLRLPKGFATAREAAAEMIRKDNLRPSQEYPYRQQRKDTP